MMRLVEIIIHTVQVLYARNQKIWCTGRKSEKLWNVRRRSRWNESSSEDIWAPDIVKVGKEYRLYCSNSSWGVRQSCIFLAVADRPEGRSNPKGVCLKQQKNFRRVLPMQLMQILSRMQKQGSSICFMALSGVAAMY